MKFKPSDKVVCIGSIPEDMLTPIQKSQSNDEFRLVGPMPRVGCIYCVDKINHFPETIGLSLVGATVIHVASNKEVGYDHRCFRKLEDIQAENIINRLKKQAESEQAALEEAHRLINSEPE